jgi:hypothetical protein
LQGEGYVPGGFAEYTAEHDVVFLLNRIADLEKEIVDLTFQAGEMAAWRGRYNALLEEAEATRPREIDSGEELRDPAEGTVVFDADRDIWVFDGVEWILMRRCREIRHTELQKMFAPYTIAYTPKEN